MKRKDSVSGMRMLRHAFSLMLCSAIFFFSGSCKDDDAKEGGKHNPDVPVIVMDISPSTGGIAKPVVITGDNFGSDKSKIKLYFDDKEAVIISAQNEHLYAVVPKLKGGEHTIRVVVDGSHEGILTDKKFDYIVASSVTTVGGLGKEANDITDGPALEAIVNNPTAIAVDNEGNIIFRDGSYNLRLLSLSANTITTILNTDAANVILRHGCFNYDKSYYYAAIYNTTWLAYELYKAGNWAQGLILNTDNVYKDYPASIAIDENNNKYLIGYKRTGIIGKIDHATGEMHILGAWPRKYDYGALIMAYNPLDKHIYVSSQYEHMIVRFDSRKETLTDDDFEIYAGRFQVEGFLNGYRTEATFNEPWGLEFDDEGNLYVADQANNAIRKIDAEGNVTTFAGTGVAGYKDGAVETSQFNNPTDVAVDPEGFIYVADYGNHRIRCIAVQ